jgi:phospholipid/cholesterol/gamma-HCH transport system substrate-binding protein
VKIRLNPFILGAFIVGAVVLAVIGFLALSSTNIFQPAGHFVIYLPNSAQGIAAGTGVRLQGVRVGQVDQLHVLYDRQSRKSFVSVLCRINENLLSDVQGHPVNLTNRRTIRHLISDGLFAQVQTAGIVGAKYIELGFNASSPPTTPTGLPPAPYPIVPTVPGTMTEVMDDISGIMSKLRSLDLQGLVQRLDDVLAGARRQLGELETNQLTTHISSAATSFGQFMSSTNLRDTVTQLQAAAVGLQTLATNLNTQVQPLATNLNTTLVSANETAQNLRDLLALRNQLGQQTQDLLRQFDQTARAIQQLADFLQRHPNALITGRAGPTGSP